MLYLMQNVKQLVTRIWIKKGGNKMSKQIISLIGVILTGYMLIEMNAYHTNMNTYHTDMMESQKKIEDLQKDVSTISSKLDEVTNKLPQ